MSAASAHGRVTYALKTGTLVRQPCLVCGETKSDAHHPDYDKPLEVEWLCRFHHSAVHHPNAPQNRDLRGRQRPLPDGFEFLHCERCGYDWTPRVLQVRQCPKCKSPIWKKKRVTVAA